MRVKNIDYNRTEICAQNNSKITKIMNLEEKKMPESKPAKQIAIENRKVHIDSRQTSDSFSLFGSIHTHVQNTPCIMYCIPTETKLSINYF